MENKKEFIARATVLAFVISLIFPLTALAIDLIIREDIDYTFEGFVNLYKDNPFHLVILSLVLVIPIIAFFTARLYSTRLAEKQRIIKIEQGKTKKINDFTQKLIKEDFSAEIDSDEDDMLSKSLMNLRDTLKTNKEIDIKRRKEDDQRSWVSEGLAKFGEILRSDINNLEALSFHTIKELTKYINAIQGGFYILKNGDTDEKHFEMTAFFAYDRKKFANQKIKWGDGLIGTSAEEQRTIYITDIPDDYVNVTSGLGQTNPCSVLVVPLIKEGELFGVIELASLNQLQQYEIDFINKIAENIASTLSMASINIKTSKLLEETKAQTQTLSSQEEEMRQNMEELQATQEEATRQAEKFVMLENTINHILMRAEYSTEGYLLYANTKFLNKLEYTGTDEVEGKHITTFIDKEDHKWFNNIWKNLSKGGTHFEGYMKHVTRKRKHLWTLATYTCIRHEDNSVDKILFLALDTDEQKKLSLKIEGIMESIDHSAIKLELDVSGNIINYNKDFLSLFGHDKKEISSLAIFDIIDNIELEDFTAKWDTIIKGMGYQGQFKAKTKSDETMWIRGAFSAVNDIYGDVEHIFFIGQNITTEVNTEMELRKKTEILKNQEKQLRESKTELNKQLRDVKIEMKSQVRDIELQNKRYELIFSSAVDGIIVTGSDNKIIFFNSAAEKIWGYNQDEVLNQDIGILFSTKIMNEDKFVSAYVGAGDAKIINTRKKVRIKCKDNKESTVSMYLSKAKIENELSYTAFIQKVDN
jgi:PAS domain S-box-containing protein